MDATEWVKILGSLGLGFGALYILGNALIEKNKAKATKAGQVIELTPKELSDIIACSVKVGVKEFIVPVIEALDNNTAALRAVETTLTRQDAKLEQFLHQGDGSW